MLFGQVPYWMLGLLGLGIVWVNALLIAAAALAEVRRLMREKNALGDVKRGKVVRGDGDGDVLGIHEIEQVGRAVDAPVPTIAWHDRDHASEVFGGAVEVDGKEIEIEATKDGDIWPSHDRQAEHARCPGDKDLDALYKSSRGAKGAIRKVRTPIQVGDEVWVARKGKLVSAIEPRAWYAAKMRMAVLFTLAELGVCGGLTAIALHQPHFGLISTFGGAGLLLFFVFVQPLGVTVEENNRSPSKTLLRGEWARSSS